MEESAPKRNALQKILKEADLLLSANSSIAAGSRLLGTSARSCWNHVKAEKYRWLCLVGIVPSKLC